MATITAPQIALGDIRTGQVSLWCKVNKTDARGVHFYVYNGAWKGILHPNRKEMTVCGNQGWSHPNDVVHKIEFLWQGKVPKCGEPDYQEAIEWLHANVVVSRKPIFDKMPEQVFDTYVYVWRTLNSLKASSTQLWETLSHAHEYEIKFVKKKKKPSKKIVEAAIDYEDEIPF